MGTIEKFAWGFCARILNAFLPIKKSTWVFGADYGRSYKEGAKYLFEYVLKNHSNIECVFITQDKETYIELKQRNLPVLLNNTFRGLIAVTRAECVFTCQYLHDILYTYKKKNRKFYYLLHGMPYKLAMHSLPSNKRTAFQYTNDNIITKIRGRLASYFVLDYEMRDVEFISVTSSFFIPYAQKDFAHEVNIRILGMPRNDGLFNTEEMIKQKWVKGIDGKFVITYMPTHRAYGAGELSPKLFQNKPHIQKWLKENNIVILVKQHPNMIPKLQNSKDTDTVIDITKAKLDPQVCLFHSDVLITDFSSVWIDYLLLMRPLIFYYYDNFEECDAGVHYSIADKGLGISCYNEDELFESIRNIYEDYEHFRPGKDKINLFHKYIDNKSCERYFKEIIRSK